MKKKNHRKNIERGCQGAVIIVHYQWSQSVNETLDNQDGRRAKTLSVGFFEQRNAMIHPF